MLYLDVEVNGHKLKAMVDSGAQATVMSPGSAEACGIMRLVDKRFAGVAQGVGTATIIGRVHSAQIKIGPLFLHCSFTVMEGKSVDLLLGLDMLKRHQACLDLARDKMIIQGVEVSFLGEADIPNKFEEVVAQEPTISGPAGTTIGQRTGAITGPTTSGEPGTSQASAGPVSSTPAVPATTPAPVAAPPQPVTAPAGNPQVTEGKINQLIAMGAPREQAVQALEAAGGDVEAAAAFIFFG